MCDVQLLLAGLKRKEAKMRKPARFHVKASETVLPGPLSICVAGQYFRYPRHGVATRPHLYTC